LCRRGQQRYEMNVCLDQLHAWGQLHHLVQVKAEVEVEAKVGQSWGPISPAPYLKTKAELCKRTSARAHERTSAQTVV
jgi:hypothetical protein